MEQKSDENSYRARRGNTAIVSLGLEDILDQREVIDQRKDPEKTHRTYLPQIGRPLPLSSSGLGLEKRAGREKLQFRGK